MVSHISHYARRSCASGSRRNAWQYCRSSRYRRSRRITRRISATDRKSTRLNSSHVKISFAVAAESRSFPTRRSCDLLPFCFWAVEAARPSSIVITGTADGVPHFALCEAVLRLRLQAQCLAILQEQPVPKIAAYHEENFCD